MRQWKHGDRIKKTSEVTLLMLILIVSCSTFIFSVNAASRTVANIHVSQEANGIRIVVRDIDLYFNATNGGEITEYFDLTVDPYHSRNLVNVKWAPYYNLLPLFTSLYYKPPNITSVLSTGGDPYAKLWLIGNTSQYVILQSSSRIMSRTGEVAKDANGNTIYVNSTWIIRDTGLISVERTYIASSYATFSSGWRWYPFYLTRTATANYNLTFHMFNTTYVYASVVNAAIYRDSFSLFRLLPNDTRHVFGVVFPYSNTSIGGDGTHNILLAYKYDELANVNQWRSDNYYSQRNNITEGGAVYEFSEAVKVSTHTYHMLINFTHQSVDQETVRDFANYYADNPFIASPIESSVTTNKDLYNPGQYYAFYGSGISHYDFTGISARLIVTDSLDRVVYQRSYGPGNIAAGQTFNLTLLKGTVAPSPSNYTILFQMLSKFGIVLSSSSKTITVALP
jgi:hypothetical protein